MKSKIYIITLQSSDMGSDMFKIQIFSVLEIANSVHVRAVNKIPYKLTQYFHISG